MTKFRLDFNHVGMRKIRVVRIHDCAVGEDGVSDCSDAVLGMEMAEEVGFEAQVGKSGKEFFGAVVDAVVKVKDAVGRRVRY